MLETSRPDVLVMGHGTIFLFDPVTQRAKEWVEDNLPEDRTEWGGAVAVEHRYIDDLVDGAERDGLVVE